MTHRLLSGARASVSNYAHLLGLPTGRPKGAKDDNHDTEDDEARKARRAEEDKQREEEDARRAEEDKRREEEDARRAEEDGDAPGDEDAENQDDEDDDPESQKGKGKGKKGKTSKADEGGGEDGDSDDDEMKGRRAERARWVSVLKHPNTGGGRIGAACAMLESTDMPARAVIDALASLPSAQGTGRQSLTERMQSAKPTNPGAGAAGGGGGQPTLAAQIVQAGKLRRGEI